MKGGSRVEEEVGSRDVDEIWGEREGRGKRRKRKERTEREIGRRERGMREGPEKNSSPGQRVTKGPGEE